MLHMTYNDDSSQGSDSAMVEMDGFRIYLRSRGNGSDGGIGCEREEEMQGILFSVL